MMLQTELYLLLLLCALPFIWPCETLYTINLEVCGLYQAISAQLGLGLGLGAVNMHETSRCSHKQMQWPEKKGCTHTHTHTHTHTCTHTHTYMHTHMHTHMHIHAHTHMHTHMHHMHTHTCTHTYTHTHTYPEVTLLVVLLVHIMYERYQGGSNGLTEQEQKAQ